MSLPLLREIRQGNYAALARALTIVENDLTGSMDLLRQLKIHHIPVLGITGPPGAGKSTLVSTLIEKWSAESRKIAVIAVDPTSPFNLGSLLGDRIRMSAHFNKPNVYIRSVAARGSVGGLSAKIVEMIDVLRAADFDYIIVETVGVGQSEIEIAGLADITMVVLVPESGDEIQHMKSGLMEIADVFVINKSDREGADTFANRLRKVVRHQQEYVPVFQTVADKKKGINELAEYLIKLRIGPNERRVHLYTEKAYRLIQYQRMKDIDKNHLSERLAEVCGQDDFNLYNFIRLYLNGV